MMPAEIKE